MYTIKPKGSRLKQKTLIAKIIKEQKKNPDALGYSLKMTEGFFLIPDNWGDKE